MKCRSARLAYIVTALCLAFYGCGGGSQPSAFGNGPNSGSGSSPSSSDNDGIENGSGGDTDGTSADGSKVVSTEGWGNLKGKFIVTGAPPAQKMKMTADVAYCGRFNILNKSLVAGENGEFLIENLPAGKHELTVWHELSGYVCDVRVNGGAKTWSRGRVEVIIKKNGDATDLGEVKVEYANLSA